MRKKKKALPYNKIPINKQRGKDGTRKKSPLTNGTLIFDSGKNHQ